MDYESVALMAAEEKAVEKNLVEPANAKSVKSTQTIKGKVAVTKFWIGCRRLYDTDKAPAPALSAQDAPIPVEQETDLKTRWSNRHNFVLPDAMILVDSNQGRMWRDCNASPPRVGVWLAEALRTRSCVDKSVGHSLAIVPGKAAETVAVIADTVARPMELYIRTRAFFMTLAYVSSPSPQWFPYQSAMAASEQILGHITATYDGRTPPVAFLVQAWAATSHHLSEQVRVTGRTPREILDNTGSWEHKWKWAPQAGTGPMTGAGSGGPDNSQRLQQEMDKMKETMKHYQSQRDAALSKANRLENDRGQQQRRQEEPPRKAQRGEGDKGSKGYGRRRR